MLGGTRTVVLVFDLVGGVRADESGVVKQGLAVAGARPAISTAVAPRWNEIDKLGAVAVIRTGLNYFLSREMQEERRTAAGERQVVSKVIETPG